MSHAPTYTADDPKGHAGSLKAPMNLLPPDALLETARVMGFGAATYGPWNFIGATVCSHTYIAAIGRHWAAYARGEDVDPVQVYSEEVAGVQQDARQALRDNLHKAMHSKSWSKMWGGGVIRKGRAAIAKKKKRV